jgi:hypothetical protein
VDRSVRAPASGREEAPGLRVYQPGEEVLEEARPASFATRKYAPGNGPLDAPPPPITVQGGRRIITRGRG